MPPELVFTFQGSRHKVKLDRDEFIVGRSKESDIVLNDASISRRHARIYRDGEQWRVVDLGSTNGTRVNNLSNTDKPLEDGDKIHVHEIAMTFVDASAPRSRPPAPVSGSTVLSDDAGNRTMQTMFRSAIDFPALASAKPETPLTAAQPVDRLRRLVTIVTEASEIIVGSHSLDETFHKMLDLVFQHMPIQRGFIMLWDEDKQDLDAICVKHESEPVGQEQQIRFSRTIAEKVYKDKVAVLTLDAQVDERFAEGKSIAALGIRSAMAAPLWNGDKVDGLIYVDTTRQARAFDDFDLDLLSALGNHLAVSIEQARLQQFVVEKEKLDRELAVARDIQMGILPQTMPPLPGYDLAGMSQPADQTGGDTFDLIPLDDRKLMMLLGDATGHGIGPALSVTQVRSMLRIALRLGAGLDDAFTNINDQLAQDLADNRFVTAFLGLFDGREHKVVYHSGGQGPLLHFHAATAECEWRGATTVPMGFMAGLPPKAAQVIEFSPGDILALITDGVFERGNAAGEMFGADRVAEVFREHHGETMARLTRILLDKVFEFGGTNPQDDDITVVLLRRLP